MSELERRLLDLGESLEVPATPPLRERVGAELRADGSSDRSRSRVGPWPADAPSRTSGSREELRPADSPSGKSRSGVRPRAADDPSGKSRSRARLRAADGPSGRSRSRVGAARRSSPRGVGARRLRVALLALLAVLLLAAGAAAAVPATRHAVLEFLGLRGESIERVPRLPENLRAKPGWRLGRPTTLAAARAQVAFQPLLPAAVDGPNGVFVNRGVPGNSLNLNYAPQAGLPRSRFTGVGLLVNELSGHAGPGFYGKLVPRDARVERFGIDGNFAVWVEGLHAFFYKPSSDNTFHIGHSRLAADALIVQRGDVMIRLEGGFDKERAVEIARSLHR